MKMVIRHPISKLYLNEEGDWVEDWTKAQHFPDAAGATRFCLTEKLEAYQVLRRHPEQRFGRVVLERLPQTMSRRKLTPAPRATF